MNEQAEKNSTPSACETEIEIPARQSPSETGKEDEPLSYRKTEEDSTMLTQEERACEGTDAE